MSEPIQVTAGFGWTAAGAWLAAVSVITLLIRQIGPWRKQTQDVTDAMLKKLVAQVARLETHIEILRQLHEGEIALLRHRVRGEEQQSIALMAVLQTLEVPQRTLDALDAQRLRKQEEIAEEQTALTNLRTTAVEKFSKLAEHAE